IGVAHEADRVLAAELERAAEAMVEAAGGRDAAARHAQREALLERRGGRHRQRVVRAVAVAPFAVGWLVEDVPEPEAAVAAQVELAAGDAADRHADLRELRHPVRGSRRAPLD